MFSDVQKFQIARQIQNILKNTEHPELPLGEIDFDIKVYGDEPKSYSRIRNNGRVEHKVKTVGELREKLAQFGDDVPIKVFSSILCNPDDPEEGTDAIEVHDIEMVVDGWEHTNTKGVNATIEILRRDE